MARFGSRVSSEGDLFLLRDQDRTKWDGSCSCATGWHALDRAASGEAFPDTTWRPRSRLVMRWLSSWPETDWPRILECYTALLSADRTHRSCDSTPRLRVRSVDGPRAAIAEIEHVVAHPALATYHLLPAVLAELWREAGETDRAAAYYRDALALVRSAPERRFLATQLEDLGA